jgi:hypothetical protein
MKLSAVLFAAFATAVAAFAPAPSTHVRTSVVTMARNPLKVRAHRLVLIRHTVAQTAG